MDSAQRQLLDLAIQNERLRTNYPKKVAIWRELATELRRYVSHPEDCPRAHVEPWAAATCTCGLFELIERHRSLL